MLKNLNKRKKKKGFTLIELVIVLAVLAIIALIAIPNFTKVRNDSLTKADIQTAEQIKKITLMAIADKDVNVPTTAGAFYTIEITGPSAATAAAGVWNTTENGESDYKGLIKDVSKPQVNGETKYVVKIDEHANVIVYQTDGTTTLTK